MPSITTVVMSIDFTPDIFTELKFSCVRTDDFGNPFTRTHSRLYFIQTSQTHRLVRTCKPKVYAAENTTYQFFHLLFCRLGLTLLLLICCNFHANSKAYTRFIYLARSLANIFQFRLFFLLYRQVGVVYY